VGVYAVWESDALATPVHGNTTFVVGDESVLVVDGSRTAAAAGETLRILRRLTSKPVAYLVNTHWHEDHVLGNAVYADSFPDLKIVAHATTAADMRSEALEEFPGFVDRLSEQLGTWRERLQSGSGRDGQPLSEDGLARARTQYEMLSYLVDQDRNARWAFPNLTFTSEVRIDLGNRTVRLLHLGRGNTAGDVVVFLPQARILVAGDLVVFPVPYGSGSFPVEWVAVMERLQRLEFDRLVPGHGPVLTDRVYIRRFAGLLEHVVAQTNAGNTQGLGEDEILSGLVASSEVMAFGQDFGASEAARRALLPFFLRPTVRRILDRDGD